MVMKVVSSGRLTAYIKQAQSCNVTVAGTHSEEYQTGFDLNGKFL